MRQQQPVTMDSRVAYYGQIASNCSYLMQRATGEPIGRFTHGVPAEFSELAGVDVFLTDSPLVVAIGGTDPLSSVDLIDFVARGFVALNPKHVYGAQYSEIVYDPDSADEAERFGIVPVSAVRRAASEMPAREIAEGGTGEMSWLKSVLSLHSGLIGHAAENSTLLAARVDEMAQAEGERGRVKVSFPWITMAKAYSDFALPGIGQVWHRDYANAVLWAVAVLMLTVAVSFLTGWSVLLPSLVWLGFASYSSVRTFRHAGTAYVTETRMMGVVPAAAFVLLSAGYFLVDPAELSARVSSSAAAAFRVSPVAAQFVFGTSGWQVLAAAASLVAAVLLVTARCYSIHSGRVRNGDS